MNGSGKPLETRVNDFVEWLFADFPLRVPRGPKVINDSVLGNQYFAAHEVAVIDTPLLQRLKHIKQTGLVYHVYPTAQHTRFEHSLGVVTLAERCLAAIRQRALLEDDRPVLELLNEDRLSGDLAHLRMAALLHDVGHGLCSHAAEQIYEFYSDLSEFKKQPKYARNAPGEVLSYLILTSDRFKRWFNAVVVAECGAKLDLDLIGELILGRHPNPDKFFLAQIVSSPYDADKLDYIARDSYYCGLALTVDLPRFYTMIATTRYRDRRVLVLRNYVPLEQILFSKMTLFGSVYHHQKVKCVDQMLRALLRHISENRDTCSLRVRGAAVAFGDPVEYLYVTDDEFFSQFVAPDDPYVTAMLGRFRRRDLFVRCVELSRRTLKTWDAYSRKLLVDLSRDSLRLKEVEDKIREALPRKAKNGSMPGEIVLSVPPPPKINPDFAYVQADPGGTPTEVSEYFPVEEWIQSYTHNKWRSFVYCPRSIVREAAAAAREVLAGEVDVDVDESASNTACRLATVS